MGNSMTMLIMLAGLVLRVLWLAGALMPGLEVIGFWGAFFGSLVLSLIFWLFRK